MESMWLLCVTDSINKKKDQSVCIDFSQRKLPLKIAKNLDTILKRKFYFCFKQKCSSCFIRISAITKIIYNLAGLYQNELTKIKLTGIELIKIKFIEIELKLKETGIELN